MEASHGDVNGAIIRLSHFSARWRMERPERSRERVLARLTRRDGWFARVGSVEQLTSAERRFGLLLPF
jgi:hypothetical protein